MHLKVEALAVANVKLLSVKDYILFVFISVCFNFDLVLLASKGNKKRGLKLLDKLDEEFKNI